MMFTICQCHDTQFTPIPFGCGSHAQNPLWRHRRSSPWDKQAPSTHAQGPCGRASEAIPLRFLSCWCHPPPNACTAVVAPLRLNGADRRLVPRGERADAIIVGVPALLVLITVLRIWYGRNAHEFPTNTDLPAVSLVADGGVAHVYVCRPVPFVYQLIAGLQQKIHIAYQIGGIDRALKEQQWLKGYTTDNVAEASLKRWVGVDVNSTSFSVSVLNHALMVWSTPVPAPLTLYVSIAL